MNINDYKSYIKQRNDTLIGHLKNQVDSIEVQYDKYKLLIEPGVFNPILGEGSLLLGKCKESLFGKNVLEIGTGSGAVSIIASEESERIVATDISRDAILCARKNINNYSLNNIIELRKGDLFEPIKNDEKFDKIIFNPPFIEGNPKSDLEKSYFDENYQTLTKFFNNAKNYLNDNGQIILCFGSVGDINYLNWLITINNFKVQFIANELMNNLQFFVYKIY